MKRWQKRVLVLLALAAVIVILRVTLFRPEPVPVTAIRADSGRVEELVVNSRAGTVESRLRARMSPAIAGLVIKLPAKKGTQTQKGETLLRLDDSEHKAQVALAERSLDAARAASTEACLSSEQATRERKRAEALAEQNLLSEEQLEVAVTKAQIAEAGCIVARERVSEARAALTAAQAVLAKTVMKAPFDGVVLDVTTEVGEWVSPSPPGVFIPPIIDVIDPTALYVSVPIDEADVARIRTGLPVRITMDAFRGRSFDGAITYVASYVETKQEQNRTLTVEAEFADEELPATLLPGISADVEVILEVRADVLRIPTYALLEGGRVLRVDGETLTEVPLETGLANWRFTEITGGLSAGDLVVISLDRPDVQAGAKVEVEIENPR